MSDRPTTNDLFGLYVAPWCSYLLMVRVLIVGCGYVGSALGCRLARAGHEVHGLRRSRQGETSLRQAGLHPLVADITDLRQIETLPGPFDWVVNTVSSSRGELSEYQRAYLEGTRNLLVWLTASLPKCYVYTSSTSVYGQTDGSLVDESSPALPSSPTGKILLQTEGLLREAARQHFPAVVLRVAGIYGPGRGRLFQQYLSGEARLSPRSGRFLNMIHRDDVAGAILAALERGRAGEIYNASDNEPVTELAFFTWLSEQLGKPLPPRADPSKQPIRKRALTDKRVSNSKLVTELGYRFEHPTYREGYLPEIRRVGGPRPGPAAAT